MKLEPTMIARKYRGLERLQRFIYIWSQQLPFRQAWVASGFEPVMVYEVKP